ncbi:hypothetical protein [Photobacterium kishitanii]|uniref:Uncharacterized protein n=1 Tax=Photobacterium kishitanii TaxID=318456 RepID=A0A2T3KLX5_9GAMM|nr:hypothetical protein [Photobacterium kishitanii]PSV00640.1 hypothetical protein C9J27_05745 [Photobacterium kishitanii]
MLSLLSTYEKQSVSSLDFGISNRNAPNILKRDTNQSIESVVEFCKKRALRYTSRSDWRNIESCSYKRASELGILDECCNHMNTPKNKKTKEACITSARKCTTIAQWKKNYSYDYFLAHKKGWAEECTKHIPKTRKNQKWTPELCQQEAIKHKTRSDWRRSSNASYLAASRLGILSTCKHASI